MIDEIDSECPECGENAAAGDCRCDGGVNIERGGVERYIEFRESGRTQTKNDRRKK